LRIIPLTIKSFASLNAESGEHFAIAAHLLLVSFPSNPSSNRLIILI